MQQYATCDKYNEEKNCMPQMHAALSPSCLRQPVPLEQPVVRIDSCKLPHINKQCVRLLKWPQSPHTFGCMCGFG